ncbi:MAG: hypothetical protein IKW00_09385 [Clostridia bacterium]|nr:hypothetical protein [Clostridia bacterium]
MNNRKSIIFVLACLLGLLFALSAQAAPIAGTTVQAGTAAELLALAEKINPEGEAVYLADRDSRMELVNIEITADIELSGSLRFKRGTNVHMYSTPGKQYKLTSTVPSSIVGFPMLMIDGAANFKLTNIIADGRNNGSDFLYMMGAEVTLGPDLIIENFASTSQFMYTVIYAINSNANPSGKLETSHFVAPKLTLDGVIYRDNNPAIPGKMAFFFTSTNTLYAPDGKLTIKNSQFLDNNGYNGGVFRAYGGEIEISDSLFENNVSKQYTAMQNGQQITTGDGGGAMHIQKAKATITNTRFVGNKSEISGGAIQAFVDADVTLNGCTFEDNEAVTHGGAICVCDSFDQTNTYPSKITVNNCVFTGNKAKGNDEGDNFASSPEAAGGGAIFLHEYCDAYLNEGTVLSGNESADEGGAVYVSFGAQLFMDDAKIEKNKAATDGGGVYLDGTDAYRGYSHKNDGVVPGNDDAYAAGGKFFMTDGLIYQNVAGGNGGGVYIGGENEVEVDGVVHRFVGGEMLMSGGVITENQAMDMGGGVFVGSSGNEDIGGIFDMVGGTVHENIAGQDGNSSTGLDDAGAEIFSVGYTSYISVVNADRITTYIRDRRNTFVPESHRSLSYDDWYDDYSDQDPEYGKAAVKIGTGVNTGRYESSIDPDRIVYTPLNNDNAYNALILGNKEDFIKEDPVIPETGDRSLLSLYAALLLVSAGACVLMRKREVK